MNNKAKKKNDSSKKKVNSVIDTKEFDLKLKEKEKKIKLLDEEIEKKETILLEKDKKKDNIVSKSKKKNINKKSKINYEKMSCYIVFLIVLFLFYAVIRNSIFIPAFLITVSLLLFCIAYQIINDKKKKYVVYGLFEFGVFLIIVAIIYTIVLLV